MQTSNTITITYGDQAEAHVGMKKNDRFLKKIKYKYRNVDLEFETYFSWD